MTRHAEMERPDKVQEAEFAREGGRHRLTRPRAVRKASQVLNARHRRPYSRNREYDLRNPNHERAAYQRLWEKVALELPDHALAVARSIVGDPS